MNEHQAFARPYESSVLDKFMDIIGRRLEPYWLTYVGLFSLQCLLVHVVAWVIGWIPTFTFSPLLCLFPVWLWGPLALMTHLDRVSIEALASYKILLDMEEDELLQIEYEFTTMPARSVAISALFWSLVYLSLTYASFDALSAAYDIGPTLANVIIVQGFISFGIGSALYYHSIRKLRLVSATVRLVKQFHLFRLDPVYAFSRVTSQIGISWMLMLSLTLLFFPIQLASAPVIALMVVQVVLAIAAFILPLWFVNRRLVTEKSRLLADQNQRIEAILERLHRFLDDNNLSEVDQLYRVLNGLNAERGLLSSIPTWPWRAGTFTNFLSAILLPIVLFVFQLVIRRWLGE